MGTTFSSIHVYSTEEVHHPKAVFASWSPGWQTMTEDPEGKIISRFSVKGDPCDIQGDYILTTDSESFYGYFYTPKQYVRIYRIIDRDPGMKENVHGISG